MAGTKSDFQRLGATSTNTWVAVSRQFEIAIQEDSEMKGGRSRTLRTTLKQNALGSK
jgi:hypothetical protein